MNNFRVYIRTAHPILQFFLLIAITFFTAGALSGLGFLITETFYGTSWENIATYINNPDSPNAVAVLKLLQLFNTLGIFLLPAMVFSQLVSPNPYTYLRLNVGITWPTLLAVIALFIAFTPITDALSWVNNVLPLPALLDDFAEGMKQSTTQMQELVGRFLIMDSFGDFLFTLFLMAVLPALGEEFLFRGVLQRLFISHTHKVHLSVWVTALLFALMHQQFFAIIPLTVLGAVLGYLKEWTGSLWAPILAHFINNATIVIVMYFTHYNMSDATEIESPQWIILIFSVLICGAILFYLIKNKKENITADDDWNDVVV